MTSTLLPLALIVRQFVDVQISIMFFYIPAGSQLFYLVLVGCGVVIFIFVALVFVSLACFSVVT